MEKKLCRVTETAVAIGFGKTKTYDLIKRGAIRSVRVDGSIRVPVSAVDEFIAGLEIVEPEKPAA